MASFRTSRSDERRLAIAWSVSKSRCACFARSAALATPAATAGASSAFLLSNSRIASCLRRSRPARFELMSETKRNNANTQTTIVTNAVLSIDSPVGWLQLPSINCRVKRKLGERDNRHDGDCPFRSPSLQLSATGKLSPTLFEEVGRIITG